MKKSLLILMIIFFISGVGAQDVITVGGANNNTLTGSVDTSLNYRSVTKKWSLNSYKAISTGFTGWRGGYATTFSVPIGVQLNRRINNNLYAFAGVSVAPTYISLRQNFMNTDFSKTGFGNNRFLKTNDFSLYQRAEIGVGYINDARTFQITGSIGVQRDPGNYRFMSPNMFSGNGPDFSQMLAPGRLYQPGMR